MFLYNPFNGNVQHKYISTIKPGAKHTFAPVNKAVYPGEW